MLSILYNGSRNNTNLQMFFNLQILYFSRYVAYKNDEVMISLTLQRHKINA